MNYIELIKNYEPINLCEEADKEMILEMAEKFDDLLFRENKIAHITSSAFVVNKSRDKTLMIHHNIFDSWSFTGGHADGDCDVINVALKELEEESSAKNYKLLSPEIISLDILPVIGHMKKGKYVSPHLHISVTFLVEVSEDDILSIKEDENNGVDWLDISKLNDYTSKEPHMQVVFNKIISKLNNFK